MYMKGVCIRAQSMEHIHAFKRVYQTVCKLSSASSNLFWQKLFRSIIVIRLPAKNNMYSIRTIYVLHIERKNFPFLITFTTLYFWRVSQSPLNMMIATEFSKCHRLYRYCEQGLAIDYTSTKWNIFDIAHHIPISNYVQHADTLRQTNTLFPNKSPWQDVMQVQLSI